MWISTSQDVRRLQAAFFNAMMPLCRLPRLVETRVSTARLFLSSLSSLIHALHVSTTNNLSRQGFVSPILPNLKLWMEVHLVDFATWNPCNPWFQNDFTKFFINIISHLRWFEKAVIQQKKFFSMSYLLSPNLSPLQGSGFRV